MLEPVLAAQQQEKVLNTDPNKARESGQGEGGVGGAKAERVIG